MTSVDPQQEALLDELLKSYTNPQDILGEHGLLKQLTQRLVERSLEAELTAHLGYAPHVRHGTADGNTRNGKGQKTVQTTTGPFDIGPVALKLCSDLRKGAQRSFLPFDTGNAATCEHMRAFSPARSSDPLDYLRDDNVL